MDRRNNCRRRKIDSFEAQRSGEDFHGGDCSVSSTSRGELDGFRFDQSPKIGAIVCSAAIYTLMQRRYAL